MSEPDDAELSRAQESPLASVTIQLFARVPVARQVKTRLIARLGAAGAAQLQRVLTERALMAARQFSTELSGLPGGVHADAKFRVHRELWLAGDLRHVWVARQRAADPALSVHKQPQGDLGLRMHVALAHACATGYGILVGTDCPGVDAAYLRAALLALAGGADVVLGPVEDGGYVLIGLRKRCAALFTAMTWSTDSVFQTTLARAQRMNLNAALLPVLWDVDRPEDVDRLRQFGDAALDAVLGLRS